MKPKDIKELSKIVNNNIKKGFYDKINNPSIKDSSANPKDLLGQNKPSISLIPPSSLFYLAEAMKNGATKYGPYNWRDRKVQSTIYVDAVFRHLLAYIDGEEDAEDSKISHLAHAMASLAILIDAKESNCLIDTRPKKGTSNEIIKRFTKPL